MLAKRLDGLWRQIAAHLGYLKGYGIGGVKFDDHQDISIYNPSFIKSIGKRKSGHGFSKLRERN
jgi:hypothetical protein